MRSFEEVLADVDHARSISDADALMRCAKELDDLKTPLAEATANRSRGTVEYLRGNTSEAMKQFERALALYKEQGNRQGVGRVMNNIGMVHALIGEYAKALEYYERALAISSDIGDKVVEASLASNIGLVNRNTGNIAAALEHFHRALACYQELEDLNGVAGATCNIGLALSDIDDYPSALDHFHRSLELSTQLGNKNFAANAICNIGSIFDSTGNYATALEHYDRALAIYEENGDKSGLANITTCIGWTHQNNGDYTAALSYHHRASALHEELGQLQEMANDICNIVLVLLIMGSDDEARVYMATLDGITIASPVLRIWREQCRAEIQERSGDHEAAVATLQRALNEGIEHGLRAKTADVHKAMRDLAQKRNDLSGYIEHNNEYTRIISEINGKDTATKLAVQEKQREIDAVQREHQKHLAVLHSTLPKHIADRVARGETVNDHYGNAAVMFLDIVGFTTLSSTLTSQQVIALLDAVFKVCDEACSQHNVTRIKTIGDSFLAVGGLEEQKTRGLEDEMTRGPAERIAKTALQIVERIKETDFKSLRSLQVPSISSSDSERLQVPSISSSDSEKLQVRIGLHCGPVTAGVLGTERLQYDVWGDTVNVASRMESTSEPNRIHVSSSFALALQGDEVTGRQGDEVLGRQGDMEPGTWHMAHEVGTWHLEQENGTWHLAPRGQVEIKGKGPLTTYWLESTIT